MKFIEPLYSAFEKPLPVSKQSLKQGQFQKVPHQNCNCSWKVKNPNLLYCSAQQIFFFISVLICKIKITERKESN